MFFCHKISSVQFKSHFFCCSFQHSSFSTVFQIFSLCPNNHSSFHQFLLTNNFLITRCVLPCCISDFLPWQRSRLLWHLFCFSKLSQTLSLQNNPNVRISLHTRNKNMFRKALNESLVSTCKIETTVNPPQHPVACCPTCYMLHGLMCCWAKLNCLRLDSAGSSD